MEEAELNFSSLVESVGYGDMVEQGIKALDDSVHIAQCS